MAPFTCPFIKRDGTICGNNCWLPIGCYRHSKLYEKNQEKRPCPICGFPTDADSGYCSKNCSKYSAKFHAQNYRMRQKCGVKTSKLSDGKGLSVVILQPRIVTSGNIPEAIPKGSAHIIDSDGEDIGIDIFGD